MAKILKNLLGLTLAGIIAAGALGCGTTRTSFKEFKKDKLHEVYNEAFRKDSQMYINKGIGGKVDMILLDCEGGRIPELDLKKWEAVPREDKEHYLETIVDNKYTMRKIEVYDKINDSTSNEGFVFENPNKEGMDYVPSMCKKDEGNCYKMVPGATFGGSGEGGDEKSKTTKPSCFTPETLIAMSDNTTKPIKNIQIEDSVKSFNFQTKQTTNNKVIAIFKFQKTGHLVINEIEVTETHPFCVGSGEWREAGMLKVGDIVIGEDNEQIEIETVEKVEKDVTVHNFTVDGTHNYFVFNGKKNFLVHNKGGGSG
jgi:hypothetical protein